jgi:hypothetical protein
VIWAAVITALAVLPVSPIVIGAASLIFRFYSRRKPVELKSIDTDWEAAHKYDHDWNDPARTLYEPPLDTPDYNPYDDYTSTYTQIRSFFSVAYFVVALLATMFVTVVGITLISANYHKCGAVDCRIDAPSKAP